MPKRSPMFPTLLAVVFGLGCIPAGIASPPTQQESQPMTTEQGAGEAGGTAHATFGGGCFWCLEAVFEELAGVKSVVSGYAGGTVENPKYEAVCRGDTGHAEVVQIEFDPAVISYLELLEVFFKTHDPTTLNRQGADVGTQSRSVIFYHDAAQRQAAEKVKKELDAAEIWAQPIVTLIEPLEKFYEAEAYHQDYYSNNPRQGYCAAVITPKLEKFRHTFAEKLRK